MLGSQYTFQEVSSSIVENGGQRFRRVNFRGVDASGELDINGFIPQIPEADYFQAGLDGTLSDLIKNFVMDRLNGQTE